MIIYAFKSITGVQWLNGQPVMWQQAGAWPQGTNLLSPTGLMPQPLGHNWPVPIAALPIAGAGMSSVNSNQGLVRVKKSKGDSTGWPKNTATAICRFCSMCMILC